MDLAQNLAISFNDPAWFDSGWGKLLTSPGVGGFAVLLAAALAFCGNWMSIRATKTTSTEKIKADKGLAEEKIAADRRAAVAARNQERKADAYLHLLESVGSVGQWVHTERFWEATVVAVDDVDIKPPPLDRSALLTGRARLSAFGSAEARQLGQDWEAVVLDVAALDRDYNRSGVENWKRTSALESMLTDTLRPKEKELAARLSMRINLELNEAADEAKIAAQQAGQTDQGDQAGQVEKTEQGESGPTLSN